MTLTASIDSIVFMDYDDGIFKEGLEDIKQRYEEGTLEPVLIFHVKDNIHYARGGRHRTYFYFHNLGKTEIPVEIVEKPYLIDKDWQHIKNGGVTVHDLKVFSIYE